MTVPPGAGFLAHGMGKELVEPDWPPLTQDEVSAVLARYGRPGAAVVTWRSPRPMSAAALVQCGGGRWSGVGAERGGGTSRARGRERQSGSEDVFVKRHHRLVRTARQLVPEHAFAAHLRARGVAVPAVLSTPEGATAIASGDYVYEVHALAGGADLYRDAPSWTPFATAAHARAAGAALARFHRASAGFGRPARPPAVLTSSCAVITAPDPLAAVARLAASRPGLARYLDRRRWREDLTRYHLPAIGRLAPLLAAQRRQWGHGDWHPSNLTWTAFSPGAGVAGVIDLGLANRTFPAHDLAVAIERSAVAWLDLAETGHAGADIPAVDALLEGYHGVRPLTEAELVAVAELLPVVHLEYALSETEYFASVVRSPDNADLAYYTYLIGHTRWFSGPEGSALLGHLRRRAAQLSAAR